MISCQIQSPAGEDGPLYSWCPFLIVLIDIIKCTGCQGIILILHKCIRAETDGKLTARHEIAEKISLHYIPLPLIIGGEGKKRFFPPMAGCESVHCHAAESDPLVKDGSDPEGGSLAKRVTGQKGAFGFGQKAISGGLANGLS
jgi:hypothetical protein